MKLTCCNLQKSYLLDEGVFLDAVDNCSLSLSSGEGVGIRGTSGSGKTSLLKLLALVDKPEAGEVWLEKEGEKKLLTALSDKEGACLRCETIGYIPQEPDMISFLNVRENITLPARIKNIPVDPAHFDWLTEMLDIGRILHKFPHTLSGGQKQRVMIARAMLLHPPILLADEPTSHLDATNAARVAALFALYREKGGGLLCASHDERILSHMERVLSMEEGKLTATE